MNTTALRAALSVLPAAMLAEGEKKQLTEQERAQAEEKLKRLSEQERVMQQRAAELQQLAKTGSPILRTTYRKRANKLAGKIASLHREMDGVARSLETEEK